MFPKKRSFGRNTRKRNIVVRRSCRDNERAQHGKYWDPIFLQRRCTGDVTLVEFRRFIDNEADNIKERKNDNKTCGGINVEGYVEEREKLIKDGTNIRNAEAEVGGPNNSASSSMTF